MSSLVDELSSHEQMPGYHYARLMAIALKSEPEEATRIRQSARFLLGEISSQNESVEALHRACNDFASILERNPEMIHAHPGDAYWPLRSLCEALDRIGIKVHFDVKAVSA